MLTGLGSEVKMHNAQNGSYCSRGRRSESRITAATAVPWKMYVAEETKVAMEVTSVK